MSQSAKVFSNQIVSIKTTSFYVFKMNNPKYLKLVVYLSRIISSIYFIFATILDRLFVIYFYAINIKRS